jgi:2-methylcitrate dehydratase
VHIVTVDGQSFTKQLDFPKGDPRNPLTDAEIEEKFSALAAGVLSKSAQTKVRDAVWSLDTLDSVSRLMALLKSNVRRRKASGGKVESGEKKVEQEEPAFAG